MGKEAKKMLVSKHVSEMAAITPGGQWQGQVWAGGGCLLQHRGEPQFSVTWWSWSLTGGAGRRGPGDTATSRFIGPLCWV